MSNLSFAARSVAAGLQGAAVWLQAAAVWLLDLTQLRILNIVVWGGMAVYMLPGAWAAAFGRARRGDPMRLACLATAIVTIGFNLRWLVIPDSITVWQALYILSAATAVYIWLLGRAYGRGDRM